MPPDPAPAALDSMTARFIGARLLPFAAAFLALIAVIPGFMQLLAYLFNMPGLDLSAFVINGSGLIIVVGVVIDTMRQIEAQLLMRNYEGFG